MSNFTAFLTDNILPLSIVIFSGWMLFEFLALCHAHRKFRRMREDDPIHPGR